MTFLTRGLDSEVTPLSASSSLVATRANLRLLHSAPLEQVEVEEQAPAIELAPLAAGGRFSRPMRAGLLVLLVVGILAGGTALKVVTSHSAAAPNSALLAKATASQQAGNSAAARADYDAILAANPSDQVALFDLGTLDQAQGQTVSAYYQYSKAILVDPSYVPALFNLAILETSSAPNAAVQLYQRIEQVDPTNAPAPFNLGLLYNKLGKTALATAQFNRAVHLQPTLVNSVPAGL